MTALYPNPRRCRYPVAALLLCLCFVPACGAPQRPVEAADPLREEEILFSCALRFLEQQQWPVLGADEMTHRIMSEWVEETPGVRRRISAFVFTHPRFGPGGTFEVHRESWDDASATWGRDEASREDEALSSSMAGAVTACWEAASSEAR